MKNLWKCLSVRADADLQEMPVVGVGRKGEGAGHFMDK